MIQMGQSAAPAALWGRFLAWAKTRDALVLAGLLLVSLVLRLVIAPYPGFYNDLNTYIRWGVDVNFHFRHFYTFGATYYAVNYPPLTVYLFWLDVRLYHLVQTITGLPIIYDTAQSSNLAIIGKLPVIFADLGIVAGIFVVARRTLSLGWSAFFAASFALSPAALFNGALWGQTDAIFSLCLLLAFWAAIAQRPIAAGLLFGLALMLKPQPVVYIPVLLIYLWKDDLRAALKAAAAATGVALVIFLPYLIPPREAFAFVQNARMSLSAPASVDGYNLWWAVGLQADAPTASLVGPLSVQMVGWGLFFAVVGIVCWGIWRTHTALTLLVGAGLVNYAFFLFTMGQHERYGYPTMIFFLAATLLQRRNWLWYVFTTFVCFANMGIIIVEHFHDFPVGGHVLAQLGAFFTANAWVTQLIAVVNVVVFGVIFGLFLRDSLLHAGPSAADASQDSLDLADAPTVKRPRFVPTSAAVR